MQGTFADVMIDDNAQQKWCQMYYSECDIRDCPSSALQIIVVTIEITIGMILKGMHMPKNFIRFYL